MTEQQIDGIYDWVDRQFRVGAFVLVDLTLLSLKLDEVSQDELVTWLTATLPAKSKLQHRERLFDYLPDYLLGGLE